MSMALHGKSAATSNEPFYQHVAVFGKRKHCLVPALLDGGVAVEAIPMYIEELLLLLTCYVEGTS